MLKTIAGTQITKVIVKDKNGNILTSDLDKIVCGGKTIYIKKCNLTVSLLYGYEDYNSYEKCKTTYDSWYPLPLKFYASWGITEKIKSVKLTIDEYLSACFSNITTDTEITTNGASKEISAKRSWTPEWSSDYPDTKVDRLLFNGRITVQFFDDTSKTYRCAFYENIGTGTKNIYNSYSFISSNV